MYKINKHKHGTYLTTGNHKCCSVSFTYTIKFQTLLNKQKIGRTEK